MTITKSVPWLLAAALALALSAQGCSGDDDDDGGSDDDDGAEFIETEPNDGFGTADDIGAAATFGGACDQNDDTDVFSVDVAAGMTSVSVAWDDPADTHDIDLAIYDSAGAVSFTPLDDDGNIPPDDSPAEVSATVTTAQTLFIEVFCGFANVPAPMEYVGTVTP